MQPKNNIIDVLPFSATPKMITESIQKHNGKLVLTGLIQRANAPNHNRRVYPKHILKREVDKYIEEKVKNNRAMGELDHPDSSGVNLKNASHIIKEIYWKDDEVYGTVEVLTTPAGNILKELFKCGVSLGISSRGMGSVREINDDLYEIEEDFGLVCWDFVSDASTHNAYMHELNESVNFKQLIPNKYQKVQDIILDILTDGSYLV